MVKYIKDPHYCEHDDFIYIDVEKVRIEDIKIRGWIMIKKEEELRKILGGFVPPGDYNSTQCQYVRNYLMKAHTAILYLFEVEEGGKCVWSNMVGKPTEREIG